MHSKIIPTSVAVVFGLTLLHGTAPADGAEVDVIVTDVTTAESMQIGEGETLFSLDQILVLTGEGLLNNLTGRCLALEEVEDETGASESNGFCTYNDSDDDKIFTEVRLKRDSLTDEASGPAKITGGTGKYEGISGRLTQTRLLLLPGPKEGVFPGVGRITGTIN
ncbi:MAG TPA: hypothetical protein VE592_11870 [Geminicoccaceae bacterium]|jgi:hypothetical protein|nr:hypothetical protein [Geminicoccaceae bacterium]